MLTFDSKITEINKIGRAMAKKLGNLGIETAEDLLFYFPFRYDDFSQITAIENLNPGQSANIVGQIELIQNKKSMRRRMSITEAIVSDESESIKVIWFNQPFISRVLKAGDEVSLSGKVEEDYGGLVMKSPEYEKLRSPLTPLTEGGQNKNAPFIKGGQGESKAVHTQGLVPNYHLTANLTHKQLRFLIKSVIHLADKVKEWLPREVLKEADLISLSEAIKKIHFPKNQEEISAARKRLAFNELFLIQLQSQLIKEDIKSSRAEPIKFKEEETKKFVDSLPFKLTNSQRKAAWEILKDMEKDMPMARLLEGDVGSGKTLVAVIAMLNAALNGKQAVLMVPTEILARQHYESISRLLGGRKIGIGLVTRMQSLITNYELRITNENKNDKISKQDVLDNIRNGNVKIIIGTHALLQEGVEFKNLALAIIDEQHRFGVDQRAKLIKQNGVFSPHLLSMTATPIPRSLALAMYGDLDLSIINEMPADRKKISTHVVPEIKRKEAYGFIRKQVDEGRQVFVICPLIDESDKLGVKSVKTEFEKLDKLVFPDLKIGILHGRLKPKEKEGTMQEFLENKIKILVSTSVVEVGVDVPNASVMMIEGADRFGLASLHQFRGRVGRSQYQSYCFLFTESNSPKTLTRLGAMEKYHDGFSLAKIDLKFRGPGEVYGTMQKGFPELKIASLFDYELMKLAKEQAGKTVEKGLDSWPALKEKVGEWERKVHLE